MLRKLIVAVSAALISSAAIASPLTEEWWDSHYQCRMGEDRHGALLSQGDIDAACEEREHLAKKLKETGLCFSDSEQEWLACAITN